MLETFPYRRDEAVTYARRWALARNPKYYDFSSIGGDCTNFVSQAVFAGCGVMNDTPLYGWYYRTLDSRSASWSSVEYFYRFLTTNLGAGPWGREVPPQALRPGDIIQLATASNHFYHTLFVTQTPAEGTSGQIHVCAHTYDALDQPLSRYTAPIQRCIHIEGARRWV